MTVWGFVAVVFVCVFLFIAVVVIKAMPPDVPEGYQLPPLGRRLRRLKMGSKTKEKGSKKKSDSEFPMTRENFMKKAHSAIELHVNIPGSDDEPEILVVPKKKFSTDSLGYFGRGGLTLMIDGEEVEGNFQFQWIAKGSKDAE